MKIEFVLAACGACTAFYLLLFNAVKRWRFVINRVFSLIALSMTAADVLYLMLMGHYNSLLPAADLFRIYAALLVIMAALSFTLIIIYPDIRYREKIIPSMLSFIPGIALAVFTVYSPEIIASVKAGRFIDIYPGRLSPIYGGIVFLYLVGGLLVLVHRFIASENRAMRYELRYILAATAMNCLLILVILAWPLLGGMHRLRTNFIHVPMLFQLLIIQYAVYDMKTMDFRQLFLKTRSWAAPFLVMAVPAGFGMYYGKRAMETSIWAGAASGIAVLAYLYLVYRFIRPRIYALFHQDYLHLIRIFRSIFDPLRNIDYLKEESELREEFFKASIYSLKESIGISGASLYALDADKKVFSFLYGFGEAFAPESIPPESALPACLEEHGHVLDRSILYTDESFLSYRASVIELFDYCESEIALPFFDADHALFGFLILGYLPKRHIYSKSMISTFEIYRIQFQRYLIKILTAHTVRLEQAAEHDKILVDNIKRRVLPSSQQHASGIRISSFSMNNSSRGGDYFDSLMLSPYRTVMFASEADYYGVDSGVLMLEMFSILHSFKKKSMTPDRLLNTMNWVIASAGYTAKYAPAAAMVFTAPDELILSYAAYNPLMIFSPEASKFKDYESTGVPLGVDASTQYGAETVHLEPGSIGLVYSDGFISSINASGEKYPMERTKSLIREHASSDPASLSRLIFADFAGFIGEKNPINDVSLMVFKTDDLQE